MQKADNWKAPTAGQLRSRINIKIPEGKDSPSKDFSVLAQIVTGGVGQNEITIRWSKELSTQIKKGCLIEVPSSGGVYEIQRQTNLDERNRFLRLDCTKIQQTELK